MMANTSPGICESYDAGPGTPHGVWPLEAANDLEPGGTATRHLLSLYLAQKRLATAAFTWVNAG